ncbi:pantoate--beta-alanine ligase [Candidatus Pelagibacter sp.]|nr:pantoate--beta-alanine ligase [Candidatus Pelagibacter sp.]
MEIFKNIFDLNKAIKKFDNFGFVPTMGGIHKGHISLIKNSQKKCKKTIVSIFVNPTQFNNKKDFVSYPRNLNKDIKILKKLKIDYLFIPNVKDIYKKKIKVIKITSLDKVLCAKFRKGHFEGVLNVMNRLLGTIKAKYIFLGEKDFQQLYLIKKYLSKRHRANIINCKTVRDKNFVALSTRNNLLTKKNYLRVVKIVKFLINLKKKLKFKKQFSKINLKEIMNKIEKFYQVQIDYLDVRNEKNLKISNTNKKFRLFVAFKINNVRLIDNF